MFVESNDLKIKLYFLFFQVIHFYYKDFPGDSDGKESACNAGDLGLIPGFDLWVGRSPGEENGYPLQYSCLENFTDRGASSVGRGTHGLQSMVSHRVGYD